MTINIWMNSTSNEPVLEQDILQDICDENIQASGNDVTYIVRERINEDYLFGETPISDFTEGIVYEMYQSNIQNFNGDGDLLSKFGVEHSDSCTFVVSVRRSAEELIVAGFVKPRPNDLIYLPFSNTLWEIRYVKNDKDYFQFGKNYSWRLECSLFQYSHETVDVDGIPDVNAEFTINLGDGTGYPDAGNSGILRRTLGIKTPAPKEESSELNTEASALIVFNPSDPFA